MSIRIVILFLLTTLLGACVPKERFWWAPDGETAVVLLDGHLQISDSSGKLSPPLPMETPEAEVTQATWLPDGSKILVSRILPIAKWEEMKLRLPPSEAERIESLATDMPSLLRAGIIAGGDAKDVGGLLNRILPEESEPAIAALTLALQRDRDGVFAAFTKAPLCLKNIREIPATQPFLLNELSLIDPEVDDPFEKRLVLGQTVRTLGGANPSPTGPFVAYAKRDGKGQSVSLEVRSLVSEEKFSVAARVYSAFDWTPDGQSLVFAAPAGPIDSVIKTIRVTQVFDKDGKLATTKSSVPDKKETSTVDLATAIIPFLPRVDCLPDGKVLFAAQSGEWPVTGTDLPGGAKLFLLSLSSHEVLSVPTLEGHLPMNLSHFVPSPDGKRAAIVESGTDAVALVDLATGETEFIASPEIDSKCRTLPAWRNSEELSYAVPDGKGGVNWVLRRLDGSLVNLSRDWPQEALTDWMEYPKEQTDEVSD